MNEPEAWGLGERSGDGFLAVLEWPAEASVDDGVPPAVAELVAAAVTDLGDVLFAWNDAEGIPWSDEDGTRREPPPGRGWLERVSRALRLGGRADVGWVRTRCASVVAHAFESATFPAWAGAQILLIADPGRRVSTRLFRLDDLTSSAWMKAVAALRTEGVVAAARPGADGAVIGVFASESAISSALRDAFAHRAGMMGFGWETEAGR